MASDPETSFEGLAPDEVVLRLNGMAKSAEALYEFVDVLYGDPSFSRPLLDGQSLDPTQGPQAVRFSLGVVYLTRVPTAGEDEAEVASTVVAEAPETPPGAEAADPADADPAAGNPAAGDPVTETAAVKLPAGVPPDEEEDEPGSAVQGRVANRPRPAPSESTQSAAEQPAPTPRQTLQDLRQRARSRSSEGSPRPPTGPRTRRPGLALPAPGVTGTIPGAGPQQGGPQEGSPPRTGSGEGGPPQTGPQEDGPPPADPQNTGSQESEPPPSGPPEEESGGPSDPEERDPEERDPEEDEQPSPRLPDASSSPEIEQGGGGR